MSRPHKKETEKLSKVLPIRCTETDLSNLKEKARKSELSISEFVRNIAINGKVIVTESTAKFDMVLELKRSGNNLNQLTKRFNATGIEPAELRNALDAHERLISKLLTTL